MVIAIEALTPGMCIECGLDEVKDKATAQVCQDCCTHPDEMVVMDDSRDGTGSPKDGIFWDCIACGGDVVPDLDDDTGAFCGYKPRLV